MPQTEQNRMLQNNDAARKRKKKKKKASRLKHMLSIIGMCAGLFVTVCLLTLAATSLTEKKKSGGNAEPEELEVLESKEITKTTVTTTTTAVTETVTTDFSTDLTTDTTEETTETTTVSTRYIPGEDEYPYFTRKYTYPHEADLTAPGTTTTTARQTDSRTDPENLLYVSYGAALRQFLLNAGEADTEPMYALTDLNGDGKPELIISGGTAAEAHHAVYGFADEKLIEMQSTTGSAFGHLYLPPENEQPILIEICESESGTETYYYEFDGEKLVLLHFFSDRNGSYQADGAAVSAEEYTAALYLTAQRTAGREIALPADAEQLTEVGGHHF